MFTCTQAFVVIWDEMYLYILNTFDSVCYDLQGKTWQIVHAGMLYILL